MRDQYGPWPRLFWFHVGQDWMGGIRNMIDVGLWARRDLMTQAADQGREVLAALRINIRWGRTFEQIDNDRLGPWRFIFRTRSDADEIALRLAGGPE